MTTYIPNATQIAEPVESRTVESAALEFRTLKTSINERLDAETDARVAGDDNLQTQASVQDERINAIEAALLAFGDGEGRPGTVYVQRLSGTGAQTAFTLNVSVPASALIDVFINGVYQNKDTFTIVGDVLTFSEAPPAGTNNVEVVISITLVNVETDASLVSFRATDSTSVVRTMQDKMREVVSVKDFGAVGDGVTDDTVAIQAAIDAVRDGVVLIPGGEYLVNSDLVLLNKGRAPEEGAFKLEATGAFFVGPGRVVVNSCKRLQINGLDMANMDLVMRGCWWSQFSNMRFKRLRINDADGTGFSSNYWNQFQQCQFQTVLTDVASTSPSNEFTFESCSLRGSAGQGFSSTAAYAFEFNANQNCQSWKFTNGDISYHTAAIYNLGGGNTSGDVELTFNSVYFDSLLPQPTDRNATHIIAVNCHHANGSVYVATLSQFTAGQVDIYRADRSWKHNAAQGINLIPNGDFRQTLTTWEGSGLPLGATNSAAVTATAGGLSGVYLNVNQALTTSNSVRFRPRALPHGGRATATLVIRNANVGSKTMFISFAGLSPSFSISDSAWSVVRITSGALLSSGTTNDLQIYTNDGTAFNVDVAYVGITLGEGSDMIVPSSGFRTIEYSESFDVPSIGAGSQSFKDFTVTGAALGDFALISSSSSLLGLQVTANVNSTDTIRMVLQNNTASPVDLGVAVWYIRVWKRLYD